MLHFHLGLMNAILRQKKGATIISTGKPAFIFYISQRVKVGIHIIKESNTDETYGTGYA